MNIKPSIKRDKETGIWIASYINEAGQKYQCNGSSAGEAIKLWYKKYSGRFNIKGG